MKFRKFSSITIYIISLIIVSIILVLSIPDYKLSMAFLPIILIISGIIIKKIIYINKNIFTIAQSIADNLDVMDEQNITKLSTPVIICDNLRNIIWFNNSFLNIDTNNKSYIRKLDYITSLPLDEIVKNKFSDVVFKDNHFRIFAVQALQNIKHKTSDIFILYLVDITHFKHIELESSLSKPCVMIFSIDNYDEVLEMIKESEKSQIIINIESILENFIAKTSGYIKKLSQSKFMAIVEFKDLQNMRKDKFSFLESIRQIGITNDIPITISVGVSGSSSSLNESHIDANYAIDLALSRGGDQVALKLNDNYEFFGGVSAGVEKRTKVKTRIISNALTDLIQSSSNVIIMGHTFSDLDCIGSGFGLATAIRFSGKDVNVVVNKERTLSSTLIQYIEEKSSNKDIFINKKQALDKIKSNTVLIIVDTHNPSFLEYPEIYKACKKFVVVDHHRKMVNHIEGSVIFYHEPYASSTSEMVSEIIQYMGKQYKLDRFAADALLSGIMLDTRNFIMKTGVRTFEAAAFLRKNGADTIAVKKLFSGSMESYQLKSNLVASSDIYKQCAIASSIDPYSENIRIVSSQAADELLTISGVNASFVIFSSGDSFNISARSMGQINVQIIMETLGGGGHQTMAATQLHDTNFEAVKNMLMESIDKYFLNKDDRG